MRLIPQLEPVLKNLLDQREFVLFCCSIAFLRSHEICGPLALDGFDQDMVPAEADAYHLF